MAYDDVAFDTHNEDTFGGDFDTGEEFDFMQSTAASGLKPTAATSTAGSAPIPDSINSALDNLMVDVRSDVST